MSFQSITNIISQKAADIPDAVAIVCNKEGISYKDLDRKSNAFAGILIQRGIKKESVVGIMMTRSIEMIIAMIGILKAGAAYMPIDPGCPAPRIEYMIDDSNMELLLINDGTKDGFIFDEKTINITTALAEYPSLLEDFTKTDICPEDLAYILYTSGSTGKPKGVMIEHKSVTNIVKAIPEFMGLEDGGKLLSITKIVFDIFVIESLLALAHGMEIYLANERELYNPRLLGKIIVKNNINIIQMTPSTVQYFLSCDKELNYLRNIETMIIGGEVFPKSLRDQIKKHSTAKIYNAYGPTEATVYCLVSDVTDKGIVDIGKPLSNYTTFIINENGELDNKGELYIGGVGVARGYINKPMLTEENFVFLPEISSDRLYKTGDLVERLPDGSINYLYRLDYQIKISGYRIELGEIECVIMEYDNIKQAAVVVKSDNDNNQYLCAVYSTYNEISESDLKKYLKSKLPQYMIPSIFVHTEKMPVNNNGKIDRNALKVSI
ncbi:amino acid adenylation domain-containing protein [Ruminiclostridium papyrosolvens]|uniref:Thioester reductase n=1 Tax=Ruminiclostridium papyrosolvens C7 TaxID=1330534 RepID=U4QWR3_9FIRM|nr:amino acid adenylation domain-containing protein [Ruminiclostridium papyrosolvens]EPR07718.1 hypothetical protein L323_19530 [Ruminiclostridium papyrosolvens C7]